MYAIAITDAKTGAEHWLCERFNTLRDAKEAAKVVKANNLPDTFIEVVGKL